MLLMNVKFTFFDESENDLFMLLVKAIFLYFLMKVTFCGGSHSVASALLHLDHPAEGGGGGDLQLIHYNSILRFPPQDQRLPADP